MEQEKTCYNCKYAFLGDDDLLDCDNYLYCSNYSEWKQKEDNECNVLKPSHYNSGNFDVIAFCLKNNIDFCRGNVIKYVVRAGKKDKSKEIEDLNKAKEYIDRIIEDLKGE